MSSTHFVISSKNIGNWLDMTLLLGNHVDMYYLCFSMNSTMWSLIKMSSNLHTTDVKLTGLYCSGLFRDPFLNSTVMFAYFHSERTIPSSSDKLNTFTIGVLINFAQQCP